MLHQCPNCFHGFTEKDDIPRYCPNCGNQLLTQDGLIVRSLTVVRDDEGKIVWEQG